MKCNKCGTPILPGEHICRFCGEADNFSERENHKQQAEIIDFKEPEIIDFTSGEDDLTIGDDSNSNQYSNYVNVPSDPIFKPFESVAPSTIPVVTSAVTPMPENMPVNNVNTIPSVTPIGIAPLESTMSIPKIDKQVVSDLGFENVNDSTPVENIETLAQAVVSDENTEKLSIDEPSLVATSEPIMVTEVKSKSEKKKFLNKVMPEINDENKKEEVKKSKNTNNKGLFNILTFALIVLLVASIILNCFLLMGSPKSNSKSDDTTQTVSTTMQTAYFNGYKIEVPSNWIVITNSGANYIALTDASQDWAATINLSNVAFSSISKNSAAITSSFGNNKYLFTTEDSKTVNKKDFYYFKGKYYNYTTYIATCAFDNSNSVIADLKFKGEVDEDVVNGILNSMTTVSTIDLTSLFSDNFDFGDVTTPITSAIASSQK